MRTCSVQFSRSVVSDSSRPHGLQHARPPCPSPTPGVYSNSCPLSRWCHPTISSSGVPFSSHLQSFPASGSFPMSQFFISSGQSIGVSASVLPMNTQDWSPLGWTGWISLPSKGPSRVFSNTTVQTLGARMMAPDPGPGGSGALGLGPQSCVCGAPREADRTGLWQPLFWSPRFSPSRSLRHCWAGLYVRGKIKEDSEL